MKSREARARHSNTNESGTLPAENTESTTENKKPDQKKAPEGAFFKQTVWLLRATSTESLVEPINTTCRVDNLLLTGIERMTVGADFQMDVLANC